MKRQIQLRVKSIIMISFIAALIPFICGAAPSTENLIFIFDASVSMESPIDNKPKIDIAKDVLIGIIKDLPSSLNVGLMAYGHRLKGDCSDVEELVPVQVLEEISFINKIVSITPVGMTPIALSIEKTAERVKRLAGNTTVILISDGQETCMGDPCGLTKKLKAAGVPFIIHVIGFGVTDLEKRQLSCVARASGGSYFSAKNTKELRLAVDNALGGTPPAEEKLKIEKQLPLYEPEKPAEPEKPEVIAPSEQMQTERATVNADNVNVREDSSRNSNVKYKIKKGQVVIIIEKKGEWYKIKLDDNRTGWTHHTLLNKEEPAEEIPADISEKAETEQASVPAVPSEKQEPQLSQKRDSDIQKLMVKSTGVRVRKEASADASIISGLKRGDVVTLLETKGEWYHIKEKTGKTGWSHKSLFYPPETGTVAKMIDIRCESISENEEKIIFVMYGFRSPITAFLVEKNNPKIICDFENAIPDNALRSHIEPSVKGKVKAIRSGIHEGQQQKFRVVLDMTPGKTYELEHIALENEGRYVLIVKSL